MAILKLVIAPNPILQKTSLPVLEITERTKEFCKDMLDTMYDFGGIGLSAVQVGTLERIIVVDLQGEKNTNKQTGQIIMINPEIIHNDSTLNLYNEGCLSFPDQFVNIERPKQIRVRYLDLDSNQCELDADGLLSTCIQHEIDHLNGKTIASYVSDLKRTMMHAKIKKIKRTMNNVI